MELHEAIRSRRSIGKVKPDPVDKQRIEQLLDAAVWAPNHGRTEPWRFFVMTGNGRLVLGNTLADIAKEGLTDPTSEDSRLLLEKQVQKALRAPVVIAVAASPADRPHVVRAEELAATHAAVQNMLLAAHEMGLGAVWRTGDAAYHPLMKRAFGLADTDELVGFVYVGYPDMATPKGMRSSYLEKTVWLDGKS